MTLTADSKGAVFDVPSANAEKFLDAASEWAAFLMACTCSLLTCCLHLWVSTLFYHRYRLYMQVYDVQCQCHC